MEDGYVSRKGEEGSYLLGFGGFSANNVTDTNCVHFEIYTYKIIDAL